MKMSPFRRRRFDSAYYAKATWHRGFVVGQSCRRAPALCHLGRAFHPSDSRSLSRRMMITVTTPGQLWG